MLNMNCVLISFKKKYSFLFQGSLVNTLQAARPTVFLGVPRVWEKINEKLVSIGRKSGSLKKYIADWAKEVGLNHYEDAMKGLVHLVLLIIITNMFFIVQKLNIY